jgi:hypothetical protein
MKIIIALQGSIMAALLVLSQQVQSHTTSLRNHRRTQNDTEPLLEAPEETVAAYVLLKASRLLDRAVAQLKAGGPDAVSGCACTECFFSCSHI